MLDQINRLKEGLNAEENPDVMKFTKAIIAGMTSFYLGTNKQLAKDRYAQFCESCEFNVEDPVPSMQVDDKQIPEISKRMCSHCGGCVLSYKLRQSIKPCEFWK